MIESILDLPLDDPDWEPPFKYLVCPFCETHYEWEWDEEDEGWWPGYAEWWYSPQHQFICSRSCYLKDLKQR